MFGRQEYREINGNLNRQLEEKQVLIAVHRGTWGEMMRKGVRVIQTDWPWQLSRYRARYFRKA